MIELGLWSLGVALAQQDAPGVDLHGAVPPLGDGTAAAPMTVRSAPRFSRGAWRVGVLLEGAETPAIRYVVDDAGSRADVLLGRILGANLGGSVALGSRVGAEITLPILGIGPETWYDGRVQEPALALGDAYLRVPIRLWAPEGGEGAAVGLAPFVALPTGNQTLQVGSGGGGGLWALAGVRQRGWSVDVSAGASAQRATTGAQQLGGVQVPVGAALGLRVLGSVWVGAEARGRWMPGADPVADLTTEVPSGLGWGGEALLSVRGTMGGATTGWGGAAVGTAVGRVAGASPLRMFVGASVGRNGRPAPAEETPVPVATGPLVLQVTEADGRTVPGAQILADGVEVGRTGPDGEVAIALEALWPRAVQVVVGDRDPVEVPAPDRTDAPLVVAMAAEPRPVRVRVTDLEGTPLTGAWSAHAEGQEPVTGRLMPSSDVWLRPGTWSLRLEVPGRAPQVRSVVVPPDGTTPSLEVVLVPVSGDAALDFAVVDGAQVGLGGARILLDGLPVGSSANGGAVRLEGLASGDHALAVEKVGYVGVERVVATDSVIDALVLAPAPGTVRIRVRQEDGRPATDAVVRFLGPSRLPAVPVDRTGERVQVLGPGDWSVIISSPTLGGQVRSLRLEEEQTGVQIVDVVLLPSEGGSADLEVSVIDTVGRPVDGAEVRLDGYSLGSTGSGGQLRIDALAVGTRSLDVRSEYLVPLEPRELALVEGPQEWVVPVRYQPGALQVRGAGPDGGAVDASIRMLSSTGESLEFSLGEDGIERVVLPVGSWSLFASSIHGTQQRELELGEQGGELQRVDLVFRPSEGGLADLVVRVVDAEGRPVAAATVELDGFVLGSTGVDGALRMQELAVGPRTLRISTPLHASDEQSIRLLEGELSVESTLEWAPGATRITVKAPDGQSVDDAMVRVLGPTEVPMGPVDGSGQRTVVLSPGAWQALASSPSRGVGVLPFPVPDEASDLLELDVIIDPMDSALADLVLRVVDGDGLPVVGATVELDGALLGQTGDGGLLRVEELRPASFQLMVRHPDHPPTVTVLDLPPGFTDRLVPMAWTLQPARVVVRDADGQPVMAEVQWRGPDDVAPSETDADGVARTLLRPGAWQALVSAGELGPGRLDFEVAREAFSGELVLGRSRVQVDAGGIQITEMVAFDFDTAILQAEANPVLDQVASALLAGGNLLRVEVQGHTDATGEPAYNLELSEARAQAVLEALVRRGVPREVLTARGYGPQRPVASNDSSEGREQNRRVQFEVQERGVP